MTDQTMSAVPAKGAAREAAMKDWAELLVGRARVEGVELTGADGLLTGLVRQVLQCGLEVEIAEHLGYERHAFEGRQTSNSRNGSSPPTTNTPAKVTRSDKHAESDSNKSTHNDVPGTGTSRYHD